MARSLERMWPGVVTVKRRFDRPQHTIKNNWTYFDTPLVRKKDVDWTNIHNLEIKPVLTQVKPIKNKELEAFYHKEYNIMSVKGDES
jgi:hypothetical protein